MSLLNESARNVASAPAVADGEKKMGRNAQKRRQILEDATLVKNAIEKANLKLDSATQAALDRLAAPIGAFGGQREDNIAKLFGTPIKAGAKVTPIDAFNKLGYGFADMRKLIKKGEDKGIVITYDSNAKEYVVKSVKG